MRTPLALAAALAFTAVVCVAEPLPPPVAAAPGRMDSRIFRVRQTVSLNDIATGTRVVRLWISIPDDGPAQRVLALSVAAAPGPWQVVRDKDRGCRFLYLEVPNPKAATLNTTVEFSVQRDAVFRDLDTMKATAMQDSQRALFAEWLRLDSPHMVVTEQIRKIFSQVCGDEKDPVLQARKLLGYVADTADHYSRNPNVPVCGVGDAGSCLAKGGGCCSDLHSLFITLARSAGIPARLQMGYRLQPANAGIEIDPGYRCWAEYFISGHGWVSADIVEADAASDAAGRARWFGGLTERRIHLNEGRDFDLPFKQSPERVNLMTIGYAEIDGKPARVLPEGDKPPQLSRKILFTESSSGQTPPALSQASR